MLTQFNLHTNNIQIFFLHCFVTIYIVIRFECRWWILVFIEERFFKLQMSSMNVQNQNPSHRRRSHWIFSSFFQYTIFKFGILRANGLRTNYGNVLNIIFI
jgi:hypothetical protein